MLNGKAYFHKYQSKATVTISTGVWKDSAWPFKDGEHLSVGIDGEKVVLTKSVKGQKKLTDTAEEK
jgi:hypothetical protein